MASPTCSNMDTSTVFNDVLRASNEYVDAVLSQNTKGTITDELDRTEPSAAKKARKSIALSPQSSNMSGPTSIPSAVEILAAIQRVESVVQKQMLDLETRVTENLPNVFRAETAKLKLDFEVEVKSLTDKVKHLESACDERVVKSQDQTNKKISTLENRVNSLKNQPVYQSNKHDRSVIIRNLSMSKREKEDQNVIINRVNQLFRDGLKLSDVKAVSGERKKRTDDKPGLVLVELESVDQRRNIHKRAKRGSGGVGLFVKNSLLHNYHAEVLDESVEDILWLKFTSRHDSDFKLLVCSTRANDGEAFFATLLEQLYTYQHEGILCICGDLNSRIGEKCDYIQGVDDIPHREVIDFHENAYGDLLIDFLVNANTCILNGRIGSQDFTYIKNGRSVVDYVITSHEQLHHFTDFNVIRTSSLVDGNNVPDTIPDHSILTWQIRAPLPPTPGPVI